MTTCESPYVPHKGLLFPAGQLILIVSNNAVSEYHGQSHRSSTSHPALLVLSPRQKLLTHVTHFFHPCAHWWPLQWIFHDLTDSVESPRAASSCCEHCALSYSQLWSGVQLPGLLQWHCEQLPAVPALLPWLAEVDSPWCLRGEKSL